MTTFENWCADIPSQFCNKKNIEVIIRAFSRQIDELLQIFDDLNVQTTLETATGQSLKYIGDILSMSVKDAGEVVRMAKEQEITDEIYRKVLQYKAIRNNCDCTYYDIMDSFALLWDISHVKYVEKLEKPATICIELPQANIDGKDPAVERVLAIKPAGVAMLYFAKYVTGVNLSGIEKARLLNIKMVTTGVSLKEIIITSALIQGMIENVEESIITSILFRGTIKNIESFGISNLLFQGNNKNVEESIITSILFRGTMENIEESIIADMILQGNIKNVEKSVVSNLLFQGNNKNVEEFVISSALFRGTIGNEEEDLETTAIFYKSYWLLDGMYRLDGTKILAAEKWEEVL